ncbi:MAG: hypothetical protein AB1938_16470 [Myxococcota bacterium]
MSGAGRWVALWACLASLAWAQPGPSPAAVQPVPDAPPAPLQPIPDASPASGDGPAEVPPPAVAPVAVPPTEKAPLFPPVNIADQIHFGVHAGVNIGLIALDLHVRRSYTFFAGNMGVPLVTNGELGATALGSGYSFPLSPPDESMWVLDVFGVANPGWRTTYDQFGGYSKQAFVGLGVGIGFRLLHWSGFTLGIKVPIFGAAINGGTRSSDWVGIFYLANVIALPIVSFGYHW